jgi:hypothetical protein
MRLRSVILAIGCLTMTGLRSPLEAQTFNFPYTYPHGINGRGEVTGYTLDNNGRHGFVRDQLGNITLFDAPGSLNTIPTSINDRGTITGRFSEGWGPTFGGAYHGFVRDTQGNITIFDAPGALDTEPNSINAQGAITGFTGGAGFIRDTAGNITVFNVPTYFLLWTDPRSIDAQGIITGDFGNSAGRHGFVRDPQGNITVFDASS